MTKDVRERYLKVEPTTQKCRRRQELPQVQTIALSETKKQPLQWGNWQIGTCT